MTNDIEGSREELAISGGIFELDLFLHPRDVTLISSNRAGGHGWVFPM